MLDLLSSRTVRRLRGYGVAVGLVVVAVGVVYVLSQVALTADAIENRTVRLVYLGALLLLFIVASALFWWRMRPRSTTRVPVQPALRRSLEQRLDGVFARHDLERTRPVPDPAAVIPAAPAPVSKPNAVAGERRSARDRLSVAVWGAAGSGKAALVRALNASLSAGARQHLALVEIPDLSAMKEENRTAGDAASDSDLVLFIVNQDLRDYEGDALRRLAGRVPVQIVLNQVDRLRVSERVEVLAAIRARTRDVVAPEDVLTAAPDPLPKIRRVTEPDGTEHDEEVPREADVRDIAERLERLAHHSASRVAQHSAPQ